MCRGKRQRGRPTARAGLKGCAARPPEDALLPGRAEIRAGGGGVEGECRVVVVVVWGENVGGGGCGG